MHDNRSLLEAMIGDGRPLLLFTGLALVLSGSFATFQAATGHFLPHDVHFLGFTAAALCEFYECRIVRFMIHDRVAFAGALIAIGALYLWLAEFPLRQRQGWAWWAFCLSGIAGFASFLTYLGYSYLDTWHGVATVGLLPCFLVGLVQSYRVVRPPALGDVLRAGKISLRRADAYAWGRFYLFLVTIGLLSAGAVIMVGGMTRVFVPQDLLYMGLQVTDLQTISPRLVPLIAHDRAGFGGGLFSVGIALGFCLWCAPPSRSLWQILLVAGSSGFGFAIGVHFAVSYLNFVHLLPAYLGALVFALGMALTYPQMMASVDNLPSAEVQTESVV